MQALKHDWRTMHLCAIEGGGTAVVFINSLGTDLRMWNEVVARLAEGRRSAGGTIGRRRREWLNSSPPPCRQSSNPSRSPAP